MSSTFLVVSWNCESADLAASESFCEWFKRLQGYCIFNKIGTLVLALQESRRTDTTISGFPCDTSDATTSSAPTSTSTSTLYQQDFVRSYDLAGTCEMMGVGATTFKNYCMRGLKLAIFTNRATYAEEYDTVGAPTIKTRSTTLPAEWQSILLHSKGAVAIDIDFGHIGVLTVVNVHLPYDAGVVNKSSEQKRLFYDRQNRAFKYVHEWARLDMSARPQHILIVGDTNYRRDDALWEQDDTSQTKTEATQRALSENDLVYLEQTIDREDRLRIEMQWCRVPRYYEGPHNKGPLFAPTCKLTKDSSHGTTNLYKYGKTSKRHPSWADRILYNTFSVDNPEMQPRLTCVEYDSIIPVQNLSDHAAVIALFHLDSFQSLQSLSFNSPLIESSGGESKSVPSE